LRIRKPACRCTEAEQGFAAKVDQPKDRRRTIAAGGAAESQMIAYVDSTVLLRLAF
jgi:hypothetical protein